MLRLLKRIALQIALVAAMFFIPVFWMLSEKTFTTTGIALASFSLCYVCLPWDLVPDCIPFIGKLDDYFAMACILLGGLIAGVGYTLALRCTLHPEEHRSGLQVVQL